VERAKATAIQIECHIDSQRNLDAIHLGIKILHKLGETSISASDSKSSSSGTNNSGHDSDIKAVRKLLDNLLKNTSERNNMRVAANSIVSSMPLLTDAKSLESMNIYNLLLVPAFLEQANLISSIACRIVKLTLQSGGGGGGMCPGSATGFMAMSCVLYAAGEADYGRLCEHISTEISHVFPDKGIRGRMLVIQNSLALPRKGFPEQLKVAYRLCNDVADHEVCMDHLCVVCCSNVVVRLCVHCSSYISLCDCCCL
jgi:hypothetical protein